MKRLFKWTLRLIALLVVAVILLLVFKDSILRAVAEHQIRAETGMDVKIGRFSSGLLSPVVTIENLRLYNTAEFGGAEFMVVPELHVEFDADALAQQNLRVKLMRFNLGQLVVVKNQTGETNIVTMLERMPKGKLAPHGIHVGGKKFEFEGIDVLNLSLGRMQFIDLKHPEKNREVPINLDNQVFSDVRTQDSLNAIAIIIFLRSGGESLFRPQNLLNDYLNRNANRPRPQVERTSSPPRK